MHYVMQDNGYIQHMFTSGTRNYYACCLVLWLTLMQRVSQIEQSTHPRAHNVYIYIYCKIMYWATHIYISIAYIIMHYLMQDNGYIQHMFISGTRNYYACCLVLWLTLMQRVSQIEQSTSGSPTVPLYNRKITTRCVRQCIFIWPDFFPHFLQVVLTFPINSCFTYLSRS